MQRISLLSALSVLGSLSTAVIIFLCLFPPPAVASADGACGRIKAYEKKYKQEKSDALRGTLAIVYNNCGVSLANEKKWNSAERYITKAIRLEPDNNVIKKSLAVVLANRGGEAFRENRLRKAQNDLEKALRYDPDNAEIKVALSNIHYRRKGTSDESRKLLNEAMEEQPGNAFLEQRVDLHERAMEVEKKTRESRHKNWIIRFEEDAGPFSREELFGWIDEITAAVGETFHYWIKHRLVFVLVSAEEFDRLHDGPDWVGALNDGRIKIPVTGRYEDPAVFQSVLAHEFTHSVITDLAHGYEIPFWLQEGMAEYQENRILARAGGRPDSFRILPQAVQSGLLLPMSVLNLSGTARLNSAQAALAYEQSLSLILYLEERFQMYSLIAVVKALGEGQSVEQAVSTGIGRDLNRLESQWHAWLAEKYRV